MARTLTAVERLADLVREALAVRLDLSPLGTDDVRTLIEQTYHLPASDASRLANEALAILDNPAFASVFAPGSTDTVRAIRTAYDDHHIKAVTTFPAGCNPANPLRSGSLASAQIGDCIVPATGGPWPAVMRQTSLGGRT